MEPALRVRAQTADQFTAQYAARSGVTVEFLRSRGQEAESCECGEEGCEGWQMVTKENDMATTHREGSVFHHEGEKVTHYETGMAPETPVEPQDTPETAPISEVPEPATDAPVTEDAPALAPADVVTAPPVKPAAKKAKTLGKHRK